MRCLHVDFSLEKLFVQTTPYPCMGVSRGSLDLKSSR